jgi:flagellar biosynthesis protein FliR
MTPDHTVLDPVIGVASVALMTVRPILFGATLAIVVTSLPAILRIAIGAAFAVGLFGAAPQSMPSAVELPWALASEAGTGVALGIAGGLAVWAAQGAGRAMAAAAPSTPLADGLLGRALSEALGLGAAAALLVAGAHRPLIRVMAKSWDALPAGAARQEWALAGAASAATAAGSHLIAAVGAIAAPTFAAALLLWGMVAVGQVGSSRIAGRAMAAVSGASTASLVTVATVAASASAGMLDDAFVRSWTAGLEIANGLVTAWSAGAPP